MHLYTQKQVSPLVHFLQNKIKKFPIRTKTLVVKNRSFKSHFYSAKDPDPPPFPHKNRIKCIS